MATDAAVRAQSRSFFLGTHPDHVEGIHQCIVPLTSRTSENVVSAWAVQTVSSTGRMRNRLIVLTNDAVYRVNYDVKRRRVLGFDRLWLPHISVVRTGKIETRDSREERGPASRWSFWKRRSRANLSAAASHSERQFDPLIDSSLDFNYEHDSSSGDGRGDGSAESNAVLGAASAAGFVRLDDSSGHYLYGLRLCAGKKQEESRTFVCREDEDPTLVVPLIKDIAHTITRARNSHDAESRTIVAEHHSFLPATTKPVGNLGVFLRRESLSVGNMSSETAKYQSSEAQASSVPEAVAPALIATPAASSSISNTSSVSSASSYGKEPAAALTQQTASETVIISEVQTMFPHMLMDDISRVVRSLPRGNDDDAEYMDRLVDELLSAQILSNDHSDLCSSNKTLTLPAPSKLTDNYAGGRILTERDVALLSARFPARLTLKHLQLLYSSHDNGGSLTTFYQKVKKNEQTLLVVMDTHRCVFGAFVSCEFHKHKDGASHYYGSGETFLFQLRGNITDRVVEQHPWTHANDYFMLSESEFLAIGGGMSGRFGLWLDDELWHGSTGPCETFGNSDPLCSVAAARELECSESTAETGQFDALVVEAWGFVDDY